MHHITVLSSNLQQLQNGWSNNVLVSLNYIVSKD